MYYYTYYSYEEWGRGYIGSRGCECLPENDIGYFGSYRDKTFNPTKKTILGIYDTREKALVDEIILHYFYDVANNPHFANQANATCTGFCFHGERASEHSRKNGIRNHKLGVGVHGLSKEQRIENSKKSGKRAYELGVGVHGLSKEQRIENSKKGIEKHSKEFALISPEGKIYSGKNINKFCKERELDSSHIYKVLKETLPHHKGWRKYIPDNIAILDFL